MGKLLYALIALLSIASATLAIMLIMSDDENRALRTELDQTKQTLEDTQEELYEKVELVSQQENQITDQQENLSALSSELQDREDQITSLQQQLVQTESDLQAAETTLQEAEEEISAIKDETEDMAERIEQSIDWFSSNSELPSTLKVDRFINKAEDGCIDGDELNLGCISYLMAEELEFSYKLDPEGDTLYSIDDIVERKGGDCEDYSLFFKAVLNHIGEDLKLEAWEPGTGRYELYTDYETQTIWYYDDTDGKKIHGDLNPYVACYYYDRYGEVWIGHCIIMLTEQEIDSPDSISMETLSDAQFFEPQDGKYMGTMGDQFGTCYDGEENCEDEFNNIVFIITDGDLFEFSNNRWNYYGGYLERTETILEDLEKIAT